MTVCVPHVGGPGSIGMPPTITECMWCSTFAAGAAPTVDSGVEEEGLK